MAQAGAFSFFAYHKAVLDVVVRDGDMPEPDTRFTAIIILADSYIPELDMIPNQRFYMLSLAAMKQLSPWFFKKLCDTKIGSKEPQLPDALRKRPYLVPTSSTHPLRTSIRSFRAICIVAERKLKK